jgi:glycosyltransferase involved in cell wall biosynthesis
MRILMLTQFFPPTIGGEERHVRDLAICLAQRGHSVSVATLWREGLPEREVDEGVVIFRIEGLAQRWRGLFSDPSRTHAPPFPDPGLVRALKRLIRSERPDVVHAHNWLLHSFLPLKRANGPGLVVTLHDASLICATKQSIRCGETCSGPGLAKCCACAARHYGAAKGVVTLAANSASGLFERRLVDCFLAVSNAVAEGNRLPGGPAPYRIVPNFVRDQVANLDSGDDGRASQLPRQPFILFVGDLRPYKGVDVLVEAYAGLESVPPLVLIGRKFHDMPTRWPANVHVFHDWPRPAVMQAWRRSMAGVVPSVGPEPCATVLMEAMACGKPVIASTAGGNSEIVENNVSGLLVRPGDRLALAQAISALTADERLRDRLAAGALRRVKAFMASSVVPRVEAVYSDVLAARRHPSGSAHTRPSEHVSAGQVVSQGDLALTEIEGKNER